MICLIILKKGCVVWLYSSHVKLSLGRGGNYPREWRLLNNDKRDDTFIYLIIHFFIKQKNR